MRLLLSSVKLATGRREPHLTDAVSPEPHVSDVLDRLTTALADRYAVQRELGSGGMAAVYLAEDLKHHRKVAVRVLRPYVMPCVDGESLRGKLQREKQLSVDDVLEITEDAAAALDYAHRQGIIHRDVERP